MLGDDKIPLAFYNELGYLPDCKKRDFNRELIRRRWG
jgi:hypothetical protein